MAVTDVDSIPMETEVWVEILEPESQRVVFANPVSGQILSEPPDGVKVKPMSENQWWELLDTASNDYYYHNPHTGQTVWDRPDSDDIITLTNLQSTEETTDTTSTGHLTEQQPILEDSFEKSSEKPKPSELPPISTDTNSTVFDVPLDTLSPLKMDFNGHGFSLLENEIYTAEQNRKSRSESGSGSGYDPRSGSGSRSGSGPGSFSSNSLPRIKLSSIENSSNVKTLGSRELNGTEENVEQATSVSTNPKQHTRPSSYTSLPEGSVDKKHESFLILSMSDINQDVSVPGSPHRSVSAKTSTRKKSSPASMESSTLGRLDSVSKNHNQSLTQGIPPAPIPPSIFPKITRSVSMQADLEKYQELTKPKRSFFFRKKVTIANMLAWTKDPIKQPMIFIRNKELKKECVELFKLVLQYMGDKKTKIKNKDELALTISAKCWEKKELRDELFVQLCRQTTANPKSESLKRGWELFTIGLHFFPPSVKFRSYLEGYLWKHVDPSSSSKGVQVHIYAQHCHKRVEKMTQWGAKKGVKKPTIEEIEYAKGTPFNPSIFGTTLEEALELQVEQYPDLDIPWVILELCETVLRLRGPNTQGIFRIPGDIDEVNALKLHLDKGKSIPESTCDPHIPASLLKLWFRELEDPLIPENYYQSCIDNCDHTNNALSLVDSLPDMNRRVLLYIIDFLQKFITPESSEQTKMGLDNIAMVWAPNFLRCPSDDHVLIFENTRKEMAFVRLLLKNIDPHLST